jgi:hypothetical protein
VTKLFGARSAAVAALLVFAFALPAAAQGNGKGLGKNKKNQQQQPQQPPDQGGGPESAPIPGSGIRNFGAWLDDATLQTPGRGWMTFSVGYWKSEFGHQWEAPGIDAGLGLGKRVQVSVTAPVSRIEYTDGTSVHGLGDVYVAAKVGLLTPDTARPYGVALIPVVEILSSNSVAEGDGRVHWGLPVSFEWRFSSFRTYGSVGYFSRGAGFAAGAVEVPLSEKLYVTASLSHSRSMEDDPLSDALELSQTRWDLTGIAGYTIKGATVFVSIGRTISRLDAYGSSLAFTAGASGGFQGRRVRR